MIPSEIKNEAGLRKVAVTTLRKLGYTVLIIGGGLAACTKCGARVQTGNGSSPGVPDLIVTHPDWPEGCWYAIELKFGNGQLRPAQRKLVQNGFVEVCKSVDTVVECVEDFGRTVKEAD